MQARELLTPLIIIAGLTASGCQADAVVQIPRPVAFSEDLKGDYFAVIDRIRDYLNLRSELSDAELDKLLSAFLVNHQKLNGYSTDDREPMDPDVVTFTVSGSSDCLPGSSGNHYSKDKVFVCVSDGEGKLNREYRVIKAFHEKLHTAKEDHG